MQSQRLDSDRKNRPAGLGQVTRTVYFWRAPPCTEIEKAAAAERAGAKR